MVKEKGNEIMDKAIYEGLSRYQMTSMIHMETDTSFWCADATDRELIEGFRDIFPGYKENKEQIMDHGMFTSAGNREVSRIIEIAREHSLDFDEVMYLLNELARFEKYAEATDTVVRESVGEALGFYA